MPWKVMLRAARWVQTYASLSFAADTPYFIAVPTKQLVWPYLERHLSDVHSHGENIRLHCLRTQSRGDQEHSPAPKLALQSLLSCRTPFDDLHFYASILLGADAFAIITIVVHARLAIFRAIDSIALAKL